MSMSRRTLLSSRAKFIGTRMASWPDGFRARISARALNALMSPNSLVIAAFQPGVPPPGIWARVIPAALEARAKASKTVFILFISTRSDFRWRVEGRGEATKRNCSTVVWIAWNGFGSKHKNVLQFQFRDFSLLLQF